MIDIDALEALAKAVGGDEWTPTHATTIGLATVWLPDGDSVCKCHGNTGHWPDAIDADDVAEYIAAVSPAPILALIAEVRALRERLEIDPRHPYDGIYCRDATIRGQDGVIDSLRSDAERYRWLRDRHFTRADNPNVDAYHKAMIATGWMYVKTMDRDGMDAAIDAARGVK